MKRLVDSQTIRNVIGVVGTMLALLFWFEDYLGWFSRRTGIYFLVVGFGLVLLSGKVRYPDPRVRSREPD